MKTRRLLGAMATVALGVTLVPVSTASVASAAGSTCVAPSGLTPDQGYRSSTPAIKNVVLSWQPVAGATSYDVQAGLDEDFASNVTFTQQTAGTKYAIPTGVLDDVSFFWRVRVHGAKCWSDNGGTSAASVTKAWDDSPQPVPGTGADTGYCATGTVTLASLRFCWRPVTHAAYYEVYLYDHATGAQAGRCFTNQTQFTPDALVAYASDATKERTTQERCFGTTTVEEGKSYDWFVRAIDQSGLAIDTDQYGDYTTGVSFAQPADHLPTGPVQVLRVDPRFGSVSGGYLVKVTGTGFVSGKISIAVAGIGVDAKNVTVVDANHLTFTMPPIPAAGTTDLVATFSDETAGGSSSESTPYDRFTAFDGTVDADKFLNAEESAESATQSFTVSAVDHTGALTAPTDVTAVAPDTTGALTVNCLAVDTSTTNDCPTTPVIRWSPVATADEYRVYIWADTNLRHLVRTYETRSSSLAIRDLLIPNQAGKAYEVQVQSCKLSGCGPVAPAAAFRIRSKPVTVTDPAQGASTSASNITLSWNDYLSTNGSSLENGQYIVQVATDCSFETLVDSAQVDVAQYTSPTLVYADGTYYWRVAAIDASGTQLAWGPAPNRDATTSSPDCGDVRHFTIDRSGGVTTAPGTTTPVSTPLSIHYGVPVVGLNANTVQLVETSTGRVVPSVFTGLPDGASVLPALKDLVPGDYYVVKVTGAVTDLSGNSVVALPESTYRAATRLDAPGIYVTLGGSWQSRKAKGAYGGTAVVTSSAKRPSASVVFRGSSISVGYCKGPSNGYISIYVDGKLKKTLSTYKAFTQCGSPTSASAPHYTVGKLDGNKQHHVTVVETGKKGTRKGRSAAIDWFQVA